MSKIRIEAFVSIPPCSGGVAVKRLLKAIESEYGDQVEIVFHTGPGDPEWEQYAINNAPALSHRRLGQVCGPGAQQRKLGWCAARSRIELVRAYVI